MANFTENYNLKKPLETEFFDVEDTNGNMEIIDAVLNENAEAIAQNASDIADGDADLQQQIDALSFNQLIFENQTMDTGLVIGDCVIFDGTKWIKTSTPEGLYLGDNVVAISGFATLTGFSLDSGYTYFAKVDGKIGLAVTSYPVGKAVSVNQMIIDFNPKKTYPKAYTENMIQFLAMPGVSGSVRLKIENPLLSDGAEIYQSTSPYAGEGRGNWGTLVADITDDSSYKGANDWCTIDSLTNGTVYYYKAFPYKGGIYNDTEGDNETAASAGGLTHEYSMDDVSGSVVNDSAGSNNLSTANCSFQEGLVGNEVSTNSSAYLRANTPLIGTVASIDFWVTPRNFTGFQNIPFSQTEYIYPEKGWRCSIWNTGIDIYSWDNASGLSFSYNFNLDQRYHIHFDRASNNSWVLYVNNVAVGSIGSLNITDNNKNFVINGYHQQEVGASGQMDIDQFRIFNRVLTEAERTNLYNGGVGC